MNEGEIRRSLREWLSRASKGTPPPEVRDDTLLMEQRVISSLQLAELLLYLEQLRGRPIEIEDLTPAAFRSVDALWKHFFGGADA